MDPNGGITVCGMVTGTHTIEDIKVNVPHRVAVFIPAEDVIRSRDVQIAIQQRKIFILDNHVVVPPGLRVRGTPPPKRVPAAPPAVSARNDAELQKTLRDTQVELRKSMAREDKSKAREDALAAALAASQEQFAAIQGTLDRIEAKESTVVVQGGAGGVQASDVVGGDVPKYIPEQIKPEKAETRITVKKEEGSSNVSGAVSKLREMRKKQQEA